MEKLTHNQLLSRLSQFSGAQHEAAAIDDHEFARECADVVSIITEVLEARTKLAGTGATFIDIPMLPRTCVTSTAISIVKAAHKAGKRAMIATTQERGRWLMKEHGIDHTLIVQIGDIQMLSSLNVIVVDDAPLMEIMFSKIYPSAGGLRDHLSKLARARVYWLKNDSN